MDQLRAQLASTRKNGRAEVAVPGLDVLQWLVAQPPQSRGYWSDRDTAFELAGVGRADVITGEDRAGYEALLTTLHDRLDQGSGSLRYFGGLRFVASDEEAEEWAAFKQYRFILPRFEVVRREGETVFACNTRAGDDLAAVGMELEKVVFNHEKLVASLPAPTARMDSPTAEAWTDAVNALLGSLANTALEKAVLARCVRFDMEAPVNAAVLLHALKLATHDRFCFCFQPDADHAFVGVSPERLYRREGRALRTEAIAGTRPRGEDEVEDRKLATELMETEKERREHRYVVEGIRETLTPLCEELKTDSAPGILQLNRGQHLISRFEGELLEGVTDGQVLSALHPTPAVGGTPTMQALEKIGQLETFDRGWYAGPVGWLSDDAAQFAVGIRAALVDRSVLRVYSGAGIVAGSEAGAEWAELENKISDYLQVLLGP